MREVCDSAGNAVTPFFWAFNLQVPSKENYSAIAYFVSFDPIVDGSLIGRFVRGDDDFRNSRLKLIANVVNGPWIVKTAVGEQAICILGRSVSCKYHQGDNFMEVDVDIGASILANAIVHLALGYVSTLTVDLAFLIESQTEEELPEQLLGTVRFGNLDPASAVSVDVEEEKDEQLKEEDDDEEDEFEDAVEAATEPAPASLPGRWWKSFSTYINGEEPQSKTRNGSDSSSEEG
ncbi:hypothetical protein KP509_35G019700 [Ceratopteris richardii]|nr:hypothetical protein KP509_35G019700 [Ceratopteris richardii]